MAQDNVFVGISIRNKTLTVEQVVEIIVLAQSKLRARRLLFLIADEPEMINQRVFGRGQEETLAKQVERRCSELDTIIHEGIAKATHPRLYIAVDRWKSILNSAYWDTYVRVFSRFLESEHFRSEVEDVTRRFADRRGQTIAVDQSRYLSLYLLAELPTLLSGVRHHGKVYSTMIYPVRGDEAIDSIAERLARGGYGPIENLRQECRIVRMGA